MTEETVEGPMLPIVLQIAEMEKEGTITLQRTSGNLPLLEGNMPLTAAASAKKASATEVLTDLF